MAVRGDTAIESARDEAVESKSDSSEPASGSERSVILGALPALLDDNPANLESDASAGGSPDMAWQRWRWCEGTFDGGETAIPHGLPRIYPPTSYFPFREHGLNDHRSSYS